MQLDPLPPFPSSAFGDARATIPGDRNGGPEALDFLQHLQEASAGRSRFDAAGDIREPQRVSSRERVRRTESTPERLGRLDRPKRSPRAARNEPERMKNSDDTREAGEVDEERPARDADDVEARIETQRADDATTENESEGTLDENAGSSDAASAEGRTDAVLAFSLVLVRESAPEGAVSSGDAPRASVSSGGVVAATTDALPGKGLDAQATVEARLDGAEETALAQTAEQVDLGSMSASEGEQGALAQRLDTAKALETTDSEQPVSGSTEKQTLASKAGSGDEASAQFEKGGRVGAEPGRLPLGAANEKNPNGVTTAKTSEHRQGRKGRAAEAPVAALPQATQPEASTGGRGSGLADGQAKGAPGLQPTAGTQSAQAAAPMGGASIHRGAALEAGASRTGALETAGAPEIDRGALIEQLGDQLAIHIRRGARRARIALRPAELGAIRVDLEVRGEGVHARLTVEHEAVAQAIHHSSAELRTALEAARVPVGGLDVQLMGGNADSTPWSGGHTPQPQFGEHGGEQRHGGRPSAVTPSQRTSAETAADPSPVALGGGPTGRLDLTV